MSTHNATTIPQQDHRSSATQDPSPPKDLPNQPASPSEQTSYYHKPLHQYIEDLASRKPSPGGGSATALTGLQAVSLILMVTRISLRKAEQKPSSIMNREKRTTLSSIIEESKRIQDIFAEYIDKDIQVFQKILQTHKAFSQNPSPHTHEALKTSIETSIKLCDDMLRLSKDITRLAHESTDISYEALLSDIEIAKILAEATERSAQINKDINTKSLQELPDVSHETYSDKTLALAH